MLSANETGPGYEIVRRPTGRFLLLTGEWTETVRSVIDAQSITHLRLSVHKGFAGISIEFLREIPQLEKLDIVAPAVKDFSPLYALPRLKKLNLDGKLASIDFPRITNLEELLIGAWSSKNFGSVFQCHTVKKLTIGGYNAADLREFAALKDHLEGLSLGRLKLERLDGIPAFPKLVRLYLTLAPRLQSLAGVEQSPHLQVLWVEAAGSLEHIDSVSELKELRTLILSDCPWLESIQPIRGLPKLETVGLMAKTNIKDGDVSVLRTLPSLIHARFVDRRHYSNKDAEFPKGKGSFY